MNESFNQASGAAVIQSTSAVIRSRRSVVYVAVLLLAIVGALVTYKATAALAVLHKTQATGTFAPRVNLLPIPGNPLQLNPIQRSINYFVAIGPALIFGILISGVVRVLVRPRDWARLLGRGSMRPQLVAGAAGAPLMLCSCCVAPIFSSMYERSSRLGPSLATALAAPSLNPFALILTFTLFGSRVGFVRVVSAALLVFVGSAIIGKLFETNVTKPIVDTESSDRPTIAALLRSWSRVAIRTVPLIVIGVLLSMMLARWWPAAAFTSPAGKLVSIIAVAVLAVPLAMPTFFEIPLALILLSAGAPPAAAMAMLIAGPAINLPSLLTIGRATNWKIPVAVAAFVFAVALIGALLIGVI